MVYALLDEGAVLGILIQGAKVPSGTSFEARLQLKCPEDCLYQAFESPEKQSLLNTTETALRAVS